MFKPILRLWYALALPLVFCLAFSLSSVAGTGGGEAEFVPEIKLSINGYEGVLRVMEVPAALLAIKELEIGQPPFLKELETVEAYGLDSSQSGVLQKGAARVHVFKLTFRSEGQAVTSLNLRRQRSAPRPGLMVEDPMNTRNPFFGLFFDGTSWSGFRRVKEVLILLKGAVPQEDFFRIMEKVFEGKGKTTDQVIRIGLLGTFKGPLAMQGIEMRDGALLALDQVRQREGVRGHSFELIVADDRGDPEEAVRQAKRLIEVEKVSAILGPVNSGLALALIPVVAEARIPMITLATHPDLTRPLHRYVFRGNISDEDLGRIIADYTAISTVGEDVALLYEDSPYGRAGMEIVRQRLRRWGIEPLAVERYVSGSLDFRAQMARFQQTRVKTLIVYGTMVDAKTVMQAITTSGLRTRVVASSGWESGQLLSMVPEGLEVVVAGYAHLSGEPDMDQFPSWVSFRRAFRDRYGRNPDPVAGYAYSNMLCLLEAMERVRFDRERIVEGLEATENFLTVFDHFINYHDENHDGMRYINFSAYRKGRVELAAKDKSLDATKMREKELSIEVAGYQGVLSPMPPNAAAFFALHIGFGHPPFMKQIREMGFYGGFRSDYEFYGIKYAYSGTVSQGVKKIVVVKMVFRSPERAVAVLNLEATKETLEGKTRLERRPEEMRDTESGVSYAEGEWSAYQRKGSTLVFAKGVVPLKDLKAVLDALL